MVASIGSTTLPRLDGDEQLLRSNHRGVVELTTLRRRSTLAGVREEVMNEKRHYTQEEADKICSEFHGYLTADKVKLVVPAMQHLIDALPNVRHKGEHVDMSTITDDILQQLKTINMAVRNAPTDEEIAEHLMTHDPKDLS